MMIKSSHLKTSRNIWPNHTSQGAKGKKGSRGMKGRDSEVPGPVGAKVVPNNWVKC